MVGWPGLELSLKAVHSVSINECQTPLPFGASTRMTGSGVALCLLDSRRTPNHPTRRTPMLKYTLLAINALIQSLVLIFLNVALFVLAILAIFTGDFTMFVVLLSLAYILAHTAIPGAAQHNRDLTDEINRFKLSRYRG